MSSNRSDPRSARLTADATRRKRETETMELRTRHREEQMIKRRALHSTTPVAHIPDIAAAIEEYAALINMDDEESQLKGASGFQQLLLAEKQPPIDQVINAGVVRRLLDFHQHPNGSIQYMALWALTNIAAGKHDHANYLVEVGATQEFVRLLSHPDPKIREQACWALGNIAGDCPELRDEVLNARAMPSVLELLKAERGVKLSTVKTATWTMSNLCRGKPPPDFKEVKAAIPVAARLIYSLDKDVEIDALWTLVFLSDGADKKQAAVAAETVCQRLVLLLQTNELEYLVPAVRTIGNLMSGDDATTQKVIDNGALTYLCPLLSHARSGLRKEACWSISNVLAGNSEQIQACIDAQLIVPILERLRDDRADIKKEAAWCIANAVSGANSKQLIYFVEELQILGPLCSLLAPNEDDDDRLIDMTLEAVDRVLQLGALLANQRNTNINPFVEMIGLVDGSKLLEELQDHPSEPIFAKAKHILEFYFGATPDEPAQIDSNQQYGWGQTNTQSQNGSTRFQGGF